MALASVLNRDSLQDVAEATAASAMRETVRKFAKVRIDFALRSDEAALVGLEGSVVSIVRHSERGTTWANSFERHVLFLRVNTTHPETRAAVQRDNAKFWGWTPQDWSKSTFVCTVVMAEQVNVTPEKHAVGARFAHEGWQQWFAQFGRPYYHNAALGSGSWQPPLRWPHDALSTRAATWGTARATLKQLREAERRETAKKRASEDEAGAASKRAR